VAPSVSTAVHLVVDVIDIEVARPTATATGEQGFAPLPFASTSCRRVGRAPGIGVWGLGMSRRSAEPTSPAGNSFLLPSYGNTNERSERCHQPRSG
jgi:hypothetical protein